MSGLRYPVAQNCGDRKPAQNGAAVERRVRIADVGTVIPCLPSLLRSEPFRTVNGAPD